MSILKTIGILIGITILFFFLKYIIVNWKTLKKVIASYFINNFGSFFYICLFLIFFVFTIYPLLGNSSALEVSMTIRKLLFVFMFVIIIIYSIWIYKLRKPESTESTESTFSNKLFYILQFIIIIYSVWFNTTENFDSFPFFNNLILKYIFWIFFWGIIAFFSYFLIKTYKNTDNSNNITASSITQTTVKYLGVFIIMLSISKLFFNKTTTALPTTTPDEIKINLEKYARELLTFNTNETNEYITYLAYFLIVTNMISVLFKWSFIKWIQIIVLFIVIIFIIFIILFMNLFNFTNPQFNKDDGTYFNANYIFLFILFLLSFLVLFKINPDLLHSSSNYLYIIGFVFGLVILFSLSLLFNNVKSVDFVLNGVYSTEIKYGIVTLITFLFIYFISSYVKKTISSLQTSNDNPVMFATGSILSIGLLVGLFVGLYFLMSIFNQTSYIFNVGMILALNVVCFFLFKSLISTFDSHSNTKVCGINTELWKWREISCFVFLIIGLFVSKSVTTLTPMIDVGLFFVFIILGYYFGGYLYYQKEKNNKVPEKLNCGKFLNNNPKLGFLETIKSIIMISIVVVLFFSMNIVVTKLSTDEDFDSLFKYFLGLFFIVLFFIYFRFSNSSFTYIIELTTNIFSNNYFSSPNTHKLNDFLFLIFVLFVFFSSMGLLERTVVSEYIQNPISYIGNIFGLNKNSSYFYFFDKIYYTILLIFNIIMFIPCIFNDIYLYFYETSKVSGAFTYILIIEFCLILFYILYRKFITLVVKRHTEILFNEPEWLYPPIVISNGAYDGIQANIPETVTYNFGISCWIYIEPGISNAFLNILNYNDSPAILYKPSMNSLIVTSQLNPENTDIEYRLKGVNTSNTLVNESIKSFTTLSDNRNEGVKNQKIVFTGDIKLQAWNNIFINYNDGTIDVFVNGKLMNSNPGNMIDASTYKNIITVGNDNENSQMKMCNLCFYNKNLNIDEITEVFDSCKNLNPPLRHH